MKTSSTRRKTTSASRLRKAGTRTSSAEKKADSAKSVTPISAVTPEKHMEPYQQRLVAQQQEFGDSIFESGREDGVRYAKSAPYRELKAIDKMVDNLGMYYDQIPIDCDALACAVCETDAPDSNTRDWVQESMSELWAYEDSYVRGFIEGISEVLREIDSLASKGA